jgi:nitrogen fixation protein NifU and related proteins
MLSRRDYIDKILDHYDHPRNKRGLDPADVEASRGNPGYGDIVVMRANVRADGKITDAGFQGEGCTISQAAASMLAEELVGKSLDDVLSMSFENVMDDMGRDVVSSRTKCETLALTIMKSASARHATEQRSRHQTATGRGFGDSTLLLR